MLVHCEAREECGNDKCIHYEEHIYDEAESILPSGTVIKSPCEGSHCITLANVRHVYVGSDYSECTCIAAGDEEDIV